MPIPTKISGARQPFLNPKNRSTFKIQLSMGAPLLAFALIMCCLVARSEDAPSGGWLLLTNKTAWHGGKAYSFEQSTSAGFNEIQALQPLSTTGPSGIVIELEAGDYRFESPIQLTNNTIIKGAGYWATRLLYDGPTNRFSLDQIMATLREDGNNLADLHTIGLIQLARPGAQFTNANAPWSWQNFRFNDFCVQTVSNCPCVLIAGYANNLYESGIGTFGPDVFRPSQGGVPSAMGPILPKTQLRSMAVIAQAIDAFQFWKVEDSMVQETAAGLLNVGNSYFDVADSGFCNVCNANGIGDFHNDYPRTNWLSIGPALFNAQSTYTTRLSDDFPYENNCDMWFEQSAQVDVYEPQYSRFNLAISGAANVSITSYSLTPPSIVAIDCQRGIYYPTNPLAWNLEDPGKNLAVVRSATYGHDSRIGENEQASNGNPKIRFLGFLAVGAGVLWLSFRIFLRNKRKKRKEKT